MVEISDTNVRQNILNIGRRRERSPYYRPDGTKTRPLPSDAQNRMYYMAKGLTLVPPKIDISNNETVRKEET